MKQKKIYIAGNKELKLKPLSIRTKRKISETLSGRIPKNFIEMQKKGIEWQKLHHGNKGSFKIGHKVFEGTEKTRFKKGMIPWCKGKKFKTGKSWNRGLTLRKQKQHSQTRKSHLVWCQVNQIHRIPNGCVIHHIDFDSFNNNLNNLQLLESKYHKVMHTDIMKILKKTTRNKK